MQKPVPQILAVVAVTSLLLALAATAWAQSTPDSYEARVYARNAVPPTPPVATATVQTAGVTCNLAPPPPTPGPPVNPRFIWWDDLANFGRKCRWDVQTTNLISGLPQGQYDGRIVAIALGLRSPESATSPFERADPPAAPTGVLFTP
jgi:hypothetical protein